MRAYLIALIAAACAGATIQRAAAADLPAYKAPIALPVYNWTGFYIGGNAGYGRGNANDTMALGGNWLTDGTGDNLIVGPLGNGQLRPSGFTGGVQAGYNFQSGAWVLGIEADANYFGLKDKFFRTVANGAPAFDSYAFSSSYRSDWLVTVRPRIGYAFDRWLVYATGGLAVANQKFAQSINQLNLPFSEAGSVSRTTAGWTVGAGGEYALDRRWSLKAEYLYVDPGSVSFATVGACPPGVVGCTLYNASHSAHLKANIVRAGVNFRWE